MEVTRRNDNIAFRIMELNKNENGCNYHIEIAIPMEYGWVNMVDFAINRNWKSYFFPLKHKENKNGYAYFENDIFLETWALYQFFFRLIINDHLYFVKKENVILQKYEEREENGKREIIKKEEKLDNDVVATEEMWKMSVNFDVPKWAMGRMMYHIFVDRFYRGSEDKMQEMPRRHIHESWDEPILVNGDEEGIWNNDFYGGDLKGVTKKLDYLESLGIEILYLSPIVYSQSTHRYDASDYEMVDPYAGNLEDLKELCDEAHKKGMKVVLDAVFNHTGSDSKYFNKYANPLWNDGKGAFNDPNSKYNSFYRHIYNEETHQMDFDYWWGFKNLPVCNGNSEEWLNYITSENGIIDKWFNCGIDGLRLDVADELTDYFIERIRIAVHRNKPDGLIIGEVWENPMYQNRGYLNSGNGMDTVMNYNLITSLVKYFRYGDGVDLANKIQEINNTYPDKTINSLMNFTSTHDMTRGINLWDLNIFALYDRWPWDLINKDHNWAQQYKLTKEQYEIYKSIFQAYVFFLCFCPGNLSIFYGDELGVQGIGNLDNRKPMPWGNYDKQMLEYFKEIGQIRKQEEFLHEALWQIRNITINYIAFERINNQDKILVLVNRTPYEQAFLVPKEYEQVEKVYSLKRSKPGLLSPYGGIAMRK